VIFDSDGNGKSEASVLRVRLLFSGKQRRGNVGRGGVVVVVGAVVVVLDVVVVVVVAGGRSPVFAFRSMLLRLRVAAGDEEEESLAEAAADFLAA